MGLLLAFLVGLAMVISIIAVTVVSLICGKWLKQKVVEKLKNRTKHKVAFADTREIVDDYLKKKMDSADEFSMEDLESMCDTSPFVAAVIDEEGNIDEYEGFKGEQYDSNFKARMKQQEGMLVCEV